MNNLHVIQHPLIQHKLAHLRDSDTSHWLFRELAKEITRLLTYEATRHLQLQNTEITTPVASMTAQVLAQEITVVPILRAGLGMVDGIIELIPKARVGHIGLYRNEKTLEPVEYYAKFPPTIAESEVIVIDPMLATGGSLSAAIGHIKKAGAKRITVICLLAAPEGVQYLTKHHPEVNIYTAALDERLNEKGYIVPGLGDAGDRLFGTA